MPVIETLLKDHCQLIKKIEDIAIMITTIPFPGKNQALAELFDTFCKQLSDHFSADDKVFYPALTIFPYLKSRLLKAYQVHDIIQNTISQLKILTYDNVSWGAKFMAIRDLILLHLKEEENEIFPVANELLISLEQEALAEKIQHQRAKLECQSLV